MTSKILAVTWNAYKIIIYVNARSLTVFIKQRTQKKQIVLFHFVICRYSRSDGQNIPRKLKPRCWIFPQLLVNFSMYIGRSKGLLDVLNVLSSSVLVYISMSMVQYRYRSSCLYWNQLVINNSPHFQDYQSRLASIDHSNTLVECKE